MTYKYSDILYRTYCYGIIIYDIMLIYNNSKNKLKKFKNNTLDAREALIIKNEWDAVYRGAYEFFLENLCESLFWPINLLSYIIPYIVLKFNR